MKNTILTLLLLLTFSTYSQKNYFGFSFAGSNPIAGLSYERTLFKNTIGLSAGIGFLSASTGFKIYPVNFNNSSIYIGGYHYLVLNPEMMGWKNYIPIGLSKDFERTRITIDVGPKIEWWDRKPYTSLNFGIGFYILN
jgi:hypothetical protein